jgi:hypothetical protein
MMHSTLYARSPAQRIDRDDSSPVDADALRYYDHITDHLSALDGFMRQSGLIQRIAGGNSMD